MLHIFIYSALSLKSGGDMLNPQVSKTQIMIREAGSRNPDTQNFFLAIDIPIS